MSKTALLTALAAFDAAGVRAILAREPQLKELRLDKGFDLLQFCCRRSTDGDSAAAQRQLRLAAWLVSEGFDPAATYTFAAGEDGEEQPATVSLAWFAVAKAQNNALARYFLKQGAAPGALFAAAWWGNADIVPDLVRHGADLNEVVEDGTPLSMAVEVVRRGVDGKPKLARQRMALLKTMLQLGANPNIRTGRGTTPLHVVLERDLGVDVFTLLLKHGADPDVAGKDGRTVRQIAARKRDPRYFRALPAPPD
jgi:hypothetical protein